VVPTPLVRIAVLLAACLSAALPYAAAQRSGPAARVGLFHVGLDHDPPGLGPLRESLKRLGYEEGSTIHLDYRNQADESAARKTARAFVEGRVDVIAKLVTNFPALILRLGLAHQIPVASHRKDAAEQGALFSYGPNYLEIGRLLAGYIDRILKGARPADLPVEQAAQLDLVINLRTAKALGLTIPPAVLLRANQVIE